MNNILRVTVTFIAVAALCAPLAAQEGAGRGASPQRGRGFSGRVAAADDGPRPQAFSVSLVLGDMQAAASGAADNVPAAARKALTDVKDFLPYKGYRLLDSQWTLCCGRSAIVTRLRGPEDQDYAVEISPSSADNGKWSVHFSLWEPRTGDSTDAARAASGIARERAELERQLEDLRKTNGENHPDVVRLRRRIDSLDSQSAGSRDAEVMRRTLVPTLRRAVIDTSFTMDVGETVVVGTSRLKGDKALIALLTAVAPTKSTTK